MAHTVPKVGFVSLGCRYYSGTEKNLKTYLKSSHKSATYSKLRALISTENSSADLDSLTITAETALEAVLEFGPGIIPANDLDGIHVHGEQLATLLRVTHGAKKPHGEDHALGVAN